MPVMKVIELLGYSDKGWEDAAQKIVDEASKTVNNIRSIYIHELSAKVENNKIVEYRLNGKVTFEIKGT
ncbi:MAG: dodecin domain-containing protein [Saprospirales bacterium]|nr:dodecin domain-containing protein [Saprospirales bacterium]MBK8490136.1 dodecin domain-containing protein [Saprospirales bacterium]